MVTSCYAIFGVIMSHSVLSTTMYFMEGREELPAGSWWSCWRCLEA